MGAYSAWVTGLLSDGARPASVSLDRTLLVADFEPEPSDLERHLGGTPRAMALPAAPENPLAGVEYFRFRTGTNPIEWDAVDAIRRGLDTVAFFLPPRDVHGRTLLHLRRLGVRRVLLPARRGLVIRSPLLLAVRRKLGTLARTTLRKLGLAEGSMSEQQCREVLSFAAPRRLAPAANRPLRIVYFVNSLNSGGAERQVCHAAVGQKERGHDVRVLVRQALVGDDAHYLPLLAEKGIRAGRIGARRDPAFAAAWRRSGPSAVVFDRLPPELREAAADLCGELLARPADVLHCHVDDANVPGAVAGCLAGTPGVVLSFRNGNPTNFPGLFRPWMRPWYRAVLGRRGICLSANSEIGARDYEHWLGLPPGSVPVVRNGFVPPALPAPSDAARWRRQQGIPPDAPVVAGVFRLEAEKRPLYFLECVDRLRRVVPGLRVLLAGVGSLEEQVCARVVALGLGGVVTPLGRRDDVPAILCAADVLLLVSDWEGTPNVVLEAQHCGCVPVATDAGGTREALEHGRTGLLVGRDDLDGAVRAVAGLLADADLRRRLAAAGPDFVRRRFSPRALDDANLRLYQTALGDGEGSACNFFTDDVETAAAPGPERTVRPSASGV
jgi:glycosyltransferase involved in cell wall biosynthesis